MANGEWRIEGRAMPGHPWLSLFAIGHSLLGFPKGSPMAGVALRNVRKTYAGGFEAIKGIDFEVGDGQFCVLVGPSGCGKSTLLRMVAGLETITSGEIDIGGRIVNQIEPAERDIAMVFQNYALYPHMSVYNNMAYGLRNRGMREPEIDARVKEAARILELTAMLDRKPRQLSGGQRQRVAMGRAIVRQPKVFLFDEPLSNLDAKLRIAMRVEIRKLQRRLKTTAIYVTHDQLEAMTLADILVVMNGGQVEQIGNPLDIYQKPATTFVASFIGAPPMNLMPLRSDEISSQFQGERRTAASEAGILGIRPEDFVISSVAIPGGIALDLTVEAIERVGAETFIYGTRRHEMQGIAANPGELPPGEVIVRIPGATAPAIGERIRAVAPREKLHLFTADGRQRIDL
jgi:sn-glycerol 3-phosphate transport system ATP-binding protein